MSFREEYVYVDAQSTIQRTWKRVLLSQMGQKIMIPASNYQCFKSVQRYSINLHQKGEKFWMPLFFDLDSEGDVGRALTDLKRIHNYLTDILQIPHHHIRIYFSGAKGFHIIVEPEVFDIRPSNDLHFKVKRAALEIKELLDLETFDVKVYSVRRLLRMANSMHEKTRLFKIELSFGEALKGVDWIKKMAAKPRKDQRPEEPELGEEPEVVEEAKDFWDKVSVECEEAKELKNLRAVPKIKEFGAMPVCMDHMLKLSSLPAAKTGNRSVLAMSSYFKDAGRSQEEAIATLVPWAQGLDNIGGVEDPSKVAAAVRAVIRFVYDRDTTDPDDPYNFSCRYILGLSTPEHKVPCMGPTCPAIQGKMQETKDTIELELADFSKSPYLGERVQVSVLVSGKAGTPFVVPKRVRFTCTPDDEETDLKKKFCRPCPISRFDGQASFEFGIKDPELLELVNTTNVKQWQAIRRKFRFPAGCRKSRGTTEEFMNIEEVRLSPAAMDITKMEKSEHVTRKGYYGNYPLKSNSRFKLTGYPVKEPGTQGSAFLFQEAEKLESEIEGFKITPQVKEELSIFQAGEGEVEDRFREIHADLAANVYRIWDRLEVAWAIDLVAHSVRGFKFRSEPFVKGWAELLLVGDSGQGKTSLVDRLIRHHYRVGELVSGGSSRRTGLLYSFQENGKTWMLIWGVIALNDLGLVIIDEFGDLPEEEFSKMTDVRSSGIIRVTGVINAETYGRVRLIALTNCRDGKHIGEYDKGVESLIDIVPAAEDIRRFDFAAAVASGEVAIETINRPDPPPVPHKFTKHLCSNLIRWTWSRREQDIEFQDSASLLILSEATRMSRDFYAGAIPLVEPADHRFKIARLAAAAAARVFSSDDTGEKLIIKDEHVGFAVSLMYLLYTNKNFRYDEWSRGKRKVEGAGTGELEVALMKIKSLPSWKHVLNLIAMPGQINARDVDGIVDGNRSQGMMILQALRSLGLLQQKYSRYTKTGKGNQFVSWMEEKHPEDLKDPEVNTGSFQSEFFQKPPGE